MKDEGFLFQNKNLPIITVELLIEILATQNVLLEQYLSDGDDDTWLTNINDRILTKKDKVIAMLYKKFGSTPQV